MYTIRRMGAGQLAGAHCYVSGGIVYFARSDCTILVFGVTDYTALTLKSTAAGKGCRP